MFLWLGMGTVFKGWGDLTAHTPPELLEVSGNAASLEATSNSAGRQQSQPISISAAVARAEYKAVDQREKRMRAEKYFFSLCGGEKFHFSRVDCSTPKALTENRENMVSQNHK